MNRKIPLNYEITYHDQTWSLTPEKWPCVERNKPRMAMFVQREQNLEQTKTYDQWHGARGRNAASNSPLAVAKTINPSFVRYFTLVLLVNKQNVSLF